LNYKKFITTNLQAYQADIQVFGTDSKDLLCIESQGRKWILKLVRTVTFWYKWKVCSISAEDFSDSHGTGGNFLV
jgi:hypothetical protein